MKAILTALLLLCCTLHNASAKPFYYDASQQDTNLHNVGRVLADDGSDFPRNFRQVEGWTALRSPQQATSHFSGHYWLVVELINHSDTAKLVLYPYNTLMSRIETRLYWQGGQQVLLSGGEVTNQFDFHYGNSVILRPGERYYLVTRFTSDYFYTPAKLVLKPEPDFIKQATRENFIMLLCFGVGIALGLYNLLIYIGSKDVTHLYYAMFTACWVFAWSHFFHISDQLFGLYSAHLHWVGFALAPITNILFYNSLLKLRETFPRLSTLSFWVGGIATAGVGVCIWSPGFGFFWSTFVTGVALCLGLYIGIKSWLNGFKPARYFVFAYVSMMVPNMIGNLTNLGILPATTVNLYLIGLIGTAMDAMLLAFALADKFRLLHHENMELNRGLEDKVVRRTRELQLVAAQLRDASEAKSRFLANMSHEIRTPMTSIIGYADAIKLGDIRPEERNQAIRVILQNSRHVLGLVNDILDMSKIEANKLEIEFVETELLAAIAHVESLLGKQIRDKGLKFNLDYHYPLPDRIVTDPTRLRQILLNLASNALKFTQRGRISMDVSCSSEQLEIRVKDTGIGMSREQVKKLFTPFYQGDSSTSRRFGGTGLGLNISKSLAQKLGGDISVSSEPDKGSEFCVTLPLRLTTETRWVETLDDVLEDKAVQQSVSAPGPLQGRVLLAEDHPDNRRLITRILERMGLEVTAVENGQEAVQATLDGQYDLILMDIQMPVMDGEQALDIILATGCTTPVIALTANIMRHEVERYKKRGFTDHLPKPIERDEFSRKVARYLGQEDGPQVSLPNDVLAQLEADFIARLGEQKTALEQAVESGKREQVLSLLHAIKGAAGLFGFSDIYAMSEEVESCIRAKPGGSLRQETAAFLALLSGYSTDHNLTTRNES